MSELRVETDGVTTTLTLDREAKRNALSADLVEALHEQVEEAGRSGARLLVLRGEGRSFSAGFDFTDYAEEGDARLLQRFVRVELLLQALAHAPITTAALVHGPTFGAGADLAVACDHRVLDPGARLRMPGLRFGLALGTRRLARVTGPVWARAVLQESRVVGAEEALAAGLATRVAGQDDWPDVVRDLAGTAASLGPAATARLDRVLTADTRDADLAELVRSAVEPGLTERIRAFREEA